MITMRRSRVWCYRCLLCYAPQARSKYMYDTIRIQPGVHASMSDRGHFGFKCRLACSRRSRRPLETYRSRGPDRLFCERLSPTVKEAPMSMCEQYVVLGSGGKRKLRKRDDLRERRRGPGSKKYLTQANGMPLSQPRITEHSLGSI